MTDKTHILRRNIQNEVLPDAVRTCFAAVPRGAEEIAAAELVALGIPGVQVGRGGVAFTADRAGLYRANLWLRTASRVLVQLSVFPCTTPEELYSGVHAIYWVALIKQILVLNWAGLCKN